MLRRLLVTLALLVPAAALLPTGGGAAHADEGLAITSTTTYTVDAVSGTVHVRSDFTLTNTLSDRVQGNIINRPYFAAFSVPAPAATVNATATTAGGRVLTVTRNPVEGVDDFVLYEVAFASRLFSGQTTTVILTYDITGLPPRSENPSRVNPAYAAFEAFGIGDEGHVTVRVVVPSGFEVDVLGSDTQVSQENGVTVHTATDIPNPDEFDIFVSARNDRALTSTAVTTPDGDAFDLRGWPGDSDWQQFVTEQIREGVPELATLIGQPWPIDGTVEVRQAYTPYLYGYAGWFSAADKEIEIGEDLDQEVVLHELSHAWFSDQWFADRWLGEGMAQVYSNKAVAALGGEAKSPLPVAATDPGRVALNDWGDPDFTDGADEVEAYGYNTSYEVTLQIVDEIGDDDMLAVFQAVADRTIPYVGDAPPEAVTGATDWRRFLDLVEEIGGSTTARHLVEQYVVDDGQAGELTARDDAREQYRALEDDGGEWAPPLAVRTEMSRWSFAAAGELIDESEDVLHLRDTLDAKSQQLGVGYPGTFEADYEAADDDLAGVTTELEAQIDAADEVLAAVAADAEDDGLLGTIGLWGTDVPAVLDEAKAELASGDLVAARADAQAAIDTVEQASDVGTTRVLLAAGALVLLVVLVAGTVVLVRRRRHRADDPVEGEC